MAVVNRENQAVQLGLVGILLLGLGLTDAHLRYVKPGMRPWLLAAGAVLVVLAITRAVAAPRARDAEDAQDGQDPHGSNLPWLLLLPVLAVTAAQPQPLGAFSAARQTPGRPPPPPPADAAYFPPLPDRVDGAHELTLIDFTDRALYDTSHQMAGQPLRLTGFVTPAPDHGVLLTRFTLACCAADATPRQVRITGLASPTPPPDTWLVVEGTWHPGKERTPTLAATSIRQIPRPANPYES